MLFLWILHFMQCHYNGDLALTQGLHQSCIEGKSSKVGGIVLNVDRIYRVFSHDLFQARCQTKGSEVKVDIAVEARGSHTDYLAAFLPAEGCTKIFRVDADPAFFGRKCSQIV